MLTPKDLYARLVSDTYRTLTDDKARMQVQFSWILRILVFFLTLTTLITLATADYRMSALTTGLALSFLLFYLIVERFKYKGVLVVSALMTLECSAVYTYVLIYGTSDGFSAIWILIMPPTSILLMGRKIGSLSNALLFSILVFLMWTPWGHSLLQYEYSSVFESRMPIIYALLYITMMFAETLRDITTKQLRESRRRMESIFQLQYSHIHERIDEARKSRHDLRHHLLILDAYLSEGKFDDARNYIQQYYQTLPFEEAMTFCEHYGTNALLTYCSQRAKQEGVEKKIHVQYPRELPIPDEDLTVVFGNLLENALDASVEGMQEDSDFVPRVTVHGSFDGSAVLFSVKNRSLHLAKQNVDHVYISTKHEGAGIGLASVQGVVDKYHGVLRIEQKEGEFTASVVMYAPQ